MAGTPYRVTEGLKEEQNVNGKRPAAVPNEAPGPSNTGVSTGPTTKALKTLHDEDVVTELRKKLKKARRAESASAQRTSELLNELDRLVCPHRAIDCGEESL